MCNCCHNKLKNEQAHKENKMDFIVSLWTLSMQASNINDISTSKKLLKRSFASMVSTCNEMLCMAQLKPWTIGFIFGDTRLLDACMWTNELTDWQSDSYIPQSFVCAGTHV